MNIKYRIKNPVWGTPRHYEKIMCFVEFEPTITATFFTST